MLLRSTPSGVLDDGADTDWVTHTRLTNTASTPTTSAVLASLPFANLQAVPACQILGSLRPRRLETSRNARAPRLAGQRGRCEMVIGIGHVAGVAQDEPDRVWDRRALLGNPG